MVGRFGRQDRQFSSQVVLVYVVRKLSPLLPVNVKILKPKEIEWKKGQIKQERMTENERELQRKGRDKERECSNDKKRVKEREKKENTNATISISPCFLFIHVYLPLFLPF